MTGNAELPADVNRVMDLIEEKLCIVWTPHKREQFVELLRAALRAQPAGVKVRGLEWVKHPTAEAWRSDTMLGTYQVWIGSRSPAWQFDGLLGERINEIAKNEEAAKAAAQADYERRILSALEAGK